jgi:tRNA(Ile)-lysidine synthase
MLNAMMAAIPPMPVLPLAGKRHILLAVSGGSDSTALLHLAARQCRELVNPPQLTAITIDHRLRAGSTTEAMGVADMAAKLAIPHRTITWDGPKPSTGIQDKARNARRGLLVAAAASAGADAVFTGHTFDDQMETVAMRQKRGPGPGLAGIAPASFVFNDTGEGEPVPFLRPLLETTRTSLRAYLDSNGASWIDDPSNDNEAFERIAVRRDLAHAGTLHIAELSHMQDKAASDRRGSSVRAATLIGTHACMVAPGLTRVDHAFAHAPEADAMAALRMILAFAAGMPHLAEPAHALQFLAIWQHAIAQTAIPTVGRGLGGALADIRREGLYLMQEQRRRSSNTASFAGRYRLSGAEPDSPPPTPKASTAAAPASLIRKTASAEPVFDCPEVGATPAHEAYRTGRRLRLLVNPWPDLVPSFDLAAYNALAHLAGARQIDSPLL